MAEARLPSERPPDYADLAEMPLVLLRRSSGPGIYEHVKAAFQRAGIACSIVADSSDLVVVDTPIQRGVAVGLLPFRSRGELPTGLVVRSFVTASASERLALVHGRGQRFLPAVQRAIDGGVISPLRLPQLC